MASVPNQFPEREGPYRIALCGKSPGADEERLGKPFVGDSGHRLNSVLSSVGLSRAECFVGNVCQVRPPGNHLYAWPWTDERIQIGIAQLLSDLATFRPNLIVTLGNVPLHLFKHGNVDPGRGADGFNWQSKVGVWRGSLFAAHESLYRTLGGGEPISPEPATAGEPKSCLSAVPSPVSGVNQSNGGPYDNATGKAGQTVCGGEQAPVRWKCLSTLHPAFTLRQQSAIFELMCDLRHAREEGTDAVLTLPAIDVQWGPPTADSEQQPTDYISFDESSECNPPMTVEEVRAICKELDEH